MSVPVKLPELGEGVTEGELVQWLVKVGDSVKPDQPVAEIMTDKATVEVPSPFAGIVKELLYKPGDTIPVEKIILHLEAAAGAPTPAPAKVASPNTNPSPSQEAPGTQAAKSSPPPAAPASSSFANRIQPPPADSRVLATPSTRRLAREMQIDLNQVQGTGLAGRVTREDVVQAQSQMGGGLEMLTPSRAPAMRAPTALSSQAQDERVPLRGIRKKIAENMQMAKHIIPHFTLMDEADVTALVGFRESLKTEAEKLGTKITYLPFVMKALISTCRQFPVFNASIDDAAQEIIYRKSFHLGFAADTPNGLVVPVIKNADTKSILQISQEILDLSRRAKEGKLKPEEMKGATITITNIGSVGGISATPIINHPEVAILGMYKILDRLALDPQGKLITTKCMNFTITADHRLIDGAVAAHFLKEFIARIQQPSRLMLDMI